MSSMFCGGSVKVHADYLLDSNRADYLIRGGLTLASCVGMHSLMRRELSDYRCRYAVFLCYENDTLC